MRNTFVKVIETKLFGLLKKGIAPKYLLNALNSMYNITKISCIKFIPLILYSNLQKNQVLHFNSLFILFMVYLMMLSVA
jgi:hypothetical protein